MFLPLLMLISMAVFIFAALPVALFVFLTSRNEPLKLLPTLIVAVAIGVFGFILAFGFSGDVPQYDQWLGMAGYGGMLGAVGGIVHWLCANRFLAANGHNT